MAKKAKAGTTFAGERPEAWLKAARHIGNHRGGYLIGHEITYRFAVEAVATILRPRFESGELVPWSPNDARWEKATAGSRAEYAAIPNNQVEAACRDLFITSETAAFVVLTWASPAARRAGEWFDVMGEDCRLPSCALDTSAKEAMAHDVIAYARRKGWLRSTRRAA
jgi:hypothetical protein